MRSIIILLVIIISMYSSVGSAQHENATIKRSIAPSYPMLEANDRVEGWALVTFTVTKEGRVIDEFIEESTQNASFDRASLRAVKRFRYEPATLDGEPIEQYWTQNLFRYGLGGTGGARAAFISEYKKILTMIQNDEIDNVPQLMEELEENLTKNNYESAWLSWLEYNYYISSDEGSAFERIDKLESATRVLDDDGDVLIYLDPDIFNLAIKELFALQVEQSRFSEALGTLETLQKAEEAKESAFYEEVLTVLQSYSEKIHEIVASDVVLKLDFVIGVSSWRNDLLKSTFSLDENDGKIEEIRLSCANQSQVLEYSAESEWAIPDSWGDCRIIVYGSKNDIFTLYEY